MRARRFRREAGWVVVPLMMGALVLTPAAASAGGGCHAGATQGTGTVVAMEKACFTPSVLRVEPGTEVTFVNEEPLAHQVSATNWGTDRDLLEGDTFTAVFEDEGIYPYACNYHLGMSGAVVVGDGDGPGSGTPVTSDVASPPRAALTSSAPAEADTGSATPPFAAALAIGLGLGAALTAAGYRLAGRRRTD